MRAVLFDCDGVLVDSEPPTFALLQSDLADHGLSLSLHELERLFIGGTLEQAAARAREMGADLAPDWVEGFYEKLYRHLALSAPLIAGVEALFERLDAAGLRYAVGSNGRAAKMEVTLGRYPAIYNRLKGLMFSGQDLGCPKPAPDLHLHAAKAVGVAPADCVVVEDSALGARAARAAGMRCYGYAASGAHPALEAEGAILFASMADLPALLGI